MQVQWPPHAKMPAQIAHEVLGIDTGRIAVRYGDTARTPYSTGTFASRSMVMAGGAVAEASRQLARRMAAIGAHLQQCEPSAVDVADGAVIGPSGSVGIAEIARVWYLNPEELPAEVDAGGLALTAGFRPNPDRRPFAYASHAATVALDPALGAVAILDYVVVEDCGTMVNPMIVDGQIQGGAVQSLGTALFEESRYDEHGQPLASAFADYLLPGAAEAPTVRIDHLSCPAPHTAFGIKGAGEGGAIPPPAVIANAVNDALAPLGAHIAETPITPARVLAAIAAARNQCSIAAPAARGAIVAASVPSESAAAGRAARKPPSRAGADDAAARAFPPVPDSRDFNWWFKLCRDSRSRKRPKGPCSEGPKGPCSEGMSDGRDGCGSGVANVSY